MFTLTPDQTLCQKIAEALWATATSENAEFATYRSQPYQGLERALIAAVRITYGFGQVRARRVRDLLAEYGPNDSLTGTQGFGIYSYAEFVRGNNDSKYYDR